MNRARRLLKAYNTLSNTPTIVISNISHVVTYVMVAMCLVNVGWGMIKGQPGCVSSNQNLSYFSMVMVLLMIRSIYTGFFEDKRRGTKNSLSALTMHLPINKEDFVLAQFIGNISLFMPAFILILGLVITNALFGTSQNYQTELGLVVILFCGSYGLITLEKGALIHYYMDPRIREIAYLTLMGIWMVVNYFMESDENKMMGQLVITNELVSKSIYELGGLSGIALIFILIGMSYLGYMKLLVILERRK